MIGSSLGRVTSVAHTGITVSDMDRALRFFVDALNASATTPELYDSPAFERITGVKDAAILIAYVDLPGHKLELLEYRAPQDRTPSVARPCDPGHIHISLMVEGIDDVLSRLKEHGFEPAGPVEQVTDGATFRVIYTYGFDNLVFELMDFSVGVA